MITPFRIFLTLILTIAFLVGMVFLFPSGKIPITDDFTLRFFSKDALLEPGGPEEVDISHIVENVQTELEFPKPTLDTLTVPEEGDTLVKDTIIQPVKEVRFVPVQIEFPDRNEKVLHSFFNALADLRSSEDLIRLFHYGDSQIEGDRITSVLRYYFHSNPAFGGCGAGLLPVKDVLQGRLAVETDQSVNWIEYSTYLKNDQEPPHNDYGILGNFYRFEPFPDTLMDTTWMVDTFLVDTFFTRNDTMPKDTLSAWWQVNKSDLGYPSTRQAEILRMMYNNNPDTLAAQWVFNETDTIDTLLSPTQSTEIVSYPFDTVFSWAEISFKGTESPELYGFALDCEKGIAVDNIGLRGSAVVNFYKMDPDELARQLRMLNVKLVVMQFGVNVVPYVVEDYGYYERMYYRNLRALKRAMPDLPVLVIGVSDMAWKEGTIYVSYPNIELIRNAQKNAALRAGCAFWDLYEAMGGKNSMVSWVHHTPALANDDYTHFTSKGSRIIGKMIYDAIMEEYDAYVESRMP